MKQYFTGPAKATPITLNYALPSVLSLRKSPGGGLWAGMALNRLHAQTLLKGFSLTFKGEAPRTFPAS